MKHILFFILIAFKGIVCIAQMQDTVYRDTVFMELEQGFDKVCVNGNPKGYKFLYRSQNNKISDCRPQEITIYLTNQDTVLNELIFEIINPFMTVELANYSHQKLNPTPDLAKNYRGIFSIKANETQIFTFRIKRGVTREGYKIQLWDRDAFVVQTRLNDIELTIFLYTNLFFLILMICYIIWTNRNKLYLWWYILYIVLGLGVILFHLGFAQVGLNLIPLFQGFIQNPYIEELIIVHLYTLCIISVSNFCSIQYKTKILYPLINKILVILRIILLLSIFLNTLYLVFHPQHLVSIPLGLLQSMSTFVLVLILIYLVIKDWYLFKEDKDNRIFSFAFSIKRIMGEVGNIKTLGYISHWKIFDIYIISPNSFHTDMLLLVGFYFEIIIVFFWIVYQTWYFEPKLAATTLAKEKDSQLRLLEDLANTRQKALTAFVNGGEQERQKMAEDFHDSFQVYLSVARRKLKNLIDNGNRQTLSKNKEDVEHIIGDIDKIQVVVKETIKRLDNKQLRENGLIMAIEDFIAQLKNPTINFQLITNPMDNLNYEVEIQLFRIIQIAIDNILKYAYASECFIQLLKDDNFITLSIEDNGIGFEVANTRRGYGLINIENRAKILGAEIHIESNPNKGTTIFISIPLTFLGL